MVYTVPIKMENTKKIQQSALLTTLTSYLTFKGNITAEFKRSHGN